MQNVRNVSRLVYAGITVAVALAALFAGPARGQVAAVAIDNSLDLVNGAQIVVKDPKPNGVTLVDMGAVPPKIIGEIDNVPCSVIGPPLSLALTPDEGLLLVTACMKDNPADAAKQMADTRVTVIDLKANPPKVIATLEAGQGPSGVSVNKQGTLALVANRLEGTVSIFSINGKTVKNAGSITVGNAASALGHVCFTPDGKRALVTRDGDNTVTILAIDGEKVTLAGRDIRVGQRPYPVDITADGNVAITGNVGNSNGDIDTIGVIDLKAAPARLVDVIAVGQTPEGMKISPDGKWCAVACNEGSNKSKSSPFYHDQGKLILFRIDGTKLTRVADAPIGHWTQGIAFSNDGKTIAVTAMVEKELEIFQFDGSTLKNTGHPVQLPGGPAAIRTAGE